MKKKYFIMLIAILLLGTLMPLIATKNIEAKPLKLNKKKMSIYAGLTYQLNVKNNELKKKVKWSSSNNKIVKVTKKGKIKAKRVGTATITAKVGKKKLKCKVKVKHLMTVKKKKITIHGEGDIEVKFPLLWKWYSVKCKIEDESILTSGGSSGWGWSATDVNDYSFYVHKTGTTYVTFTNEFNNEVVKVKVNAIFPNISFPSCPINVIDKDSYSNKIYTKATINSISSDEIFSKYTYDKNKTYDIKLKIDGIKTYDYQGNLGTNFIRFLLVLYDEKGKIVYSKSVSPSDLYVIVNQTFTCEVFLENLSWNHSYRVEIYNEVR